MQLSVASHAPSVAPAFDLEQFFQLTRSDNFAKPAYQRFDWLANRDYFHILELLADRLASNSVVAEGVLAAQGLSLDNLEVSELLVLVLAVVWVRLGAKFLMR